MSTTETVTILPTLPPRDADSNKGNFGRVLVVAGSRGMSGAAVLCGSGYRASLATSLLERARHTEAVNIRGGWAAWAHRRCPELAPRLLAA